jgi:ketosteroid isomerase-like protein
MKSNTTLLFSLLLVLCLSVAPSVMAASAEDEVLQVEKNWMKSAETADYELFSSLYLHSPKISQFHPGNVFLSQGWELFEKNWKPNYESGQKGSVTMSMHNPQVTMLGDNAAVLAFYQIVTENPPAVKEQTVNQYRVTRVLQKIDGKWLIVHDHASALPIK